MSVFVARVKNVLSGDTVIVIPSKSTQNPPPERTITLSYVKPIDEFESKEYLRQLLLGKEIKFRVFNKVGTREFGDIQAPIFNSLIEYLLTNGYVKVKETLPDDDEEVQRLKQIENATKLKKTGLWDSKKHSRITTVPIDENIILASQKKPLKLIVDRVISGDRVVATIFVNTVKIVQTTPVLLAGVKSPRTDVADQPQNITQAAKEAKYFVEQQLLTRNSLEVTLIGESQAGVPIALINNDISEKILEKGYGEVVDWQSSLIGSTIMSKLRKAEQTAKALGKGIFANTSKPAHSKVKTDSKLTPGKKTNVTISKIISADTLNVRLPDNDEEEEVTVQLASLKAPKPNDTTITNDSNKQQALIATAREFVRNQAIGKSASLYVDGFREENKDLNLPSRFLVSLKIGNTDLSETIVSAGFATVIKHNKATANERSMNWDKLIELEEVAKKGKKGMYGDLAKVLTVGTRIIDASENATKAKTFFNGFKQKGRISGYHVDFIPNATRVKLFHPKDGMRLNLILGGLSNDKANSLPEATEYLNKKYLQRNVEFEIYSTDKLGSFIGNLYTNSHALAPVQEQLLQQGLVKIHDFAINTNPQASVLIKAEDEAKEAKKGLWQNYDPIEEEESKQQGEEAKVAGKLQSLNLTNASPAKPKFFDIKVVGIDPETVKLYYHLIDPHTKQQFQTFKQQFQTFHAQSPSASKLSSDSLPVTYTSPPRKNELVAAKFSDDGKFYRAKYLGFDKTIGKHRVHHIDYGQEDTVSNIKDLRYLSSQFNLAAYPVFAHLTTLQNLRFPPDYLGEAVDAVDDLTFDKKLVLSAIASPADGVEYTGVLYDAEESLKDESYTINGELVKDGLAVVDERSIPPTVKEYVEDLLKVQKKARLGHVGCWKFGDVAFGEDESLLA